MSEKNVEGYPWAFGLATRRMNLLLLFIERGKTWGGAGLGLEIRSLLSGVLSRRYPLDIPWKMPNRQLRRRHQRLSRGSGLEKQSRRSGGHSVSRPGTSQRSVRWRSSSKGTKKEHPAEKAKHLKPKMTQQSVGQMLPRVTGARGCRQ